MVRTASGGAPLRQHRSPGCPFPMETTYEWEAVNATTTRMVLRNRGYPQGFSAWLAPFMASGIRNANKKDLKKLKQLLENES